MEKLQISASGRVRGWRDSNKRTCAWLPSGLGVWCFSGGRQPAGVGLHTLRLWQQRQSYKRGVCLRERLFLLATPLLSLFPLSHFVNLNRALQDMSSLMHNIYDVVDASVNHSSHNKSKTLRVKLTVTPEPRSHRRDTGTGSRQSEPGFPHSWKTRKVMEFCKITESWWKSHEIGPWPWQTSRICLLFFTSVQHCAAPWAQLAQPTSSACVV